jgi:hypothetical protein
MEEDVRDVPIRIIQARPLRIRREFFRSVKRCTTNGYPGSVKALCSIPAWRACHFSARRLIAPLSNPYGHGIWRCTGGAIVARPAVADGSRTCALVRFVQGVIRDICTLRL